MNVIPDIDPRVSKSEGYDGLKEKDLEKSDEEQPSFSPKLNLKRKDVKQYFKRFARSNL